MTEDDVDVLYIGGYGRSGSTLLERLLGQTPGVFSAGELRFIWDRGIRRNQRCGCGLPFRECPTWTAIGDAAFGGWDAVDVDAAVRAESHLVRHRFLPLLLAPWLWPPFSDEIRQHAGRLSRLYRGIGAATGARIVVDSTVDPSSAFLLRHAAGVRLRVIHLVRDSRGVAYSWTKAVVRPEIVGTVVLMPRRRPAGTAWRWTAYNAAFHLLAAAGVPSVRVRYEDLVGAPGRQLRRMMALVGRDLAEHDLAFLHEGEAELAVGHTVSGNPMRFTVGAVPLRTDDAWRSRLGTVDRALVSAISAPLLLAYGYVGPPSLTSRMGRRQ
jgi:hypothetical protein